MDIYDDPIAKEKDITRLFRIRRTILEMLSDRGYAVLHTEEDLLQPRKVFESEYEAQNYDKESLTLLRQKADDDKDQICVLFPQVEKNKKAGIKIIRDIYQKMHKDGLRHAIVILDIGPSPIAKREIMQLNAAGHSRMEIFVENELLVNITEHEMVPKHEVLSTEDKMILLRLYKVKESQLPRIQKTDPVARYFGLTHGIVVKITRYSESALRTVSYRICVG